MKHTIIKTFVLILALALTLSGCNLIAIDAKMQADEDIAKIEKQYAAEVAAYDGGTLTAGDIMGDFNDNYSEMYYFYAMYGISPSEEEVHMLIEDTMADRVRASVIDKHFDETNTLTDEELAAAEQTGEQNYNAMMNAALQQSTGKTEEDRQQEARVLLAAIGRSLESMKADAVRAAKVEKTEAALRDEVEEVTDEQLQAAYDQKVADDEETYTANPGAYGSAMTNGSEAYWVPDGYRTVKHILLIPEDSLMTAYTDAKSALQAKQDELHEYSHELEDANDDDVEGARTAEEIQADIDAANAELPELEAAVEAAAQACLDNVKDRSDAIYARLEAGEAFEDLMAEFGEDPGMQREPTMTTGYYVCSESANWQQEFTDGAMALGQVGDYSAEPVLSGSGVHIIEYASDVAGGAVALSTVHDALYAEELENLKDANRNDTINAWIEAVNPVYDVEAFEAALTEE